MSCKTIHQKIGLKFIENRVLGITGVDLPATMEDQVRSSSPSDQNLSDLSLHLPISHSSLISLSVSQSLSRFHLSLSAISPSLSLISLVLVSLGWNRDRGIIKKIKEEKRKEEEERKISKKEGCVQT
jgi:hypothetical protein